MVNSLLGLFVGENIAVKIKVNEEGSGQAKVVNLERYR